MADTYISFYLRVGRIYIFIDAMRQIGCPTRICFMVDDRGEHLIVRPYEKRDLKSHYVSPENYHTDKPNVRISSIRLCNALATIRGWDRNYSYRVTGKVYPNDKIVVFDLKQAEPLIR